jgi:hypothetical protein
MNTKSKLNSRVTALVCVAALVSAGTPRCFASDDAAAMAVDAVVARPLCLAMTILGGAFFVISLPAAAASKSVHQAANTLVVKPAHATFTRPLGDFDTLSDY